MKIQVIKKERHHESHRIVYLLEGDDGTWFATHCSPDDLELHEGESLTHSVSDKWKRNDGTKIHIIPTRIYHTREDAEKVFRDIITENTLDN